MFGRRRREAAAAEEAAREEERRALFARLAERPEHICPFLGLEADRTGYVDGISAEHRCFAFGDPAPLSAEQQTRVCQQRGYGNCPRYLRGVLVIPTEELEALRRPRAAPPPQAAPAEPPQRRRRGLLVPLVLAVLLLVGGASAAYLVMSGAIEIGSGSVEETPVPTATESAPPTVRETPSAAPSPSPSVAGTSPTPEPTPDPGDEFAFYEVAVAPGTYTLYLVGPGGSIDDELDVGFDGFSFARSQPVASAEGDALWVVEDGPLAGYAYRFPDSGDFRVRAVFLSDAGERRSLYLEGEELERVPEETPAPVS